jgi:hypothetical protein
MVVAAICYFGITYFLAKYNFVYIHIPLYDTVRFTKYVAVTVIIALFIFQLTMLGMFGLMVSICVRFIR